MNAPHVDWYAYSTPMGVEGEPLRPVLQVVLESPRRRTAAKALFDSGSDHSILPASLASRLGVMPRRASRNLRVFGTPIPVGRAKLDLVIPVRSGRGLLDGAEFLVPLPAIELDFVTLGRNPTFERFEVRFREWQRRFGLIERSRHAVSRDPHPARASAERGRPTGLTPRRRAAPRRPAAPRCPSAGTR